MRAFAPRAIAHAGLQATRSTLPLIGRRARNALCFEAAHPSCRVKHRSTNKARVDDNANAFDRQAGFSDVGGQHDLAHPGGRGYQGGVLGIAREIPEKGQDANAGIGGRIGQQRLNAPDLPCAGEKHEDVSGLLAERAANELGHDGLGRLGGSGRRPGLSDQPRQHRHAFPRKPRFHRIHPSLCADNRSIGQHSGYGFAVERCGHDE